MSDHAEDKVAAAARFLAEARAARRLVAGLPTGLAPADEAEAWAMHEAVVATLGPVVAWKVGAPTPTADVGVGMITADTVAASPAIYEADAFGLAAVEAEVAVTIARDFGPRDEPYSHDDVLAGVRSWHAAIEVLDTVFEDWAGTPGLHRAADRQSHGALIVGPAQPAAPHGALDRLPVRLEIDGVTVFAHEGGNTGGDPVRLLVALVNLRRGMDRIVRAGDVVTTGSATPFHRAKPGQTVRASFPGLAVAEMTLKAS